MLPNEDVVALTHAANDAFDGAAVTTIPKLNLAQRVIDLLEKIQVGDATADELNNYRELVNVAPNYPVLSETAFRGDSVIAAEMSLESMSDSFDNIVEGIAAFIRKLWNFLKGLLERFRAMLNKVLLSLQKKKREVASKHYVTNVPDNAENYVVIKDHAACGAFYLKDRKQYVTDILTTTRSIKTLFDKCFMPMLRSEVTTAETITELSSLVMQAVANGNRDSGRAMAAKMDDTYNEQVIRLNQVMQPYVGVYVNGLEITDGITALRFKTTPVTPPSSPFRIKALGGAELEQVLEMATSVTKDLKEVADNLYNRLRKVYDENTKNIEEFVNGYQSAKRSQDRLKQKDYELMQIVVTKGTSHFQGITTAIASTMNTISRYVYTIETSFYTENVRILERLLMEKTGKVSLESDEVLQRDELFTKASTLRDAIHLEVSNVRQEMLVNFDHYAKIIERLKQHIGSVPPETTIHLDDNAAFSFAGSWSPESVIEGISNYVDLVSGVQTALVTNNFGNYLSSATQNEFIGGGLNNGILYNNVATDDGDEYSLNDINNVLCHLDDTLKLVKNTLTSYVPKLNDLSLLADNSCNMLADPNVTTLIERSAIVRRLTQERNALLSGVNVLAINAYLYSAIDEFTEAVFRSLYN